MTRSCTGRVKAKAFFGTSVTVSPLASYVSRFQGDDMSVPGVERVLLARRRQAVRPRSPAPGGIDRAAEHDQDLRDSMLLVEGRHDAEHRYGWRRWRQRGRGCDLCRLHGERAVDVGDRVIGRHTSGGDDRVGSDARRRGGGRRQRHPADDRIASRRNRAATGGVGESRVGVAVHLALVVGPDRQRGRRHREGAVNIRDRIIGRGRRRRR